MWKVREVERVLAVEQRLEFRVASKLALIIILLQVLGAGVLPDAHKNARTILFVGI